MLPGFSGPHGIIEFSRAVRLCCPHGKIKSQKIIIQKKETLESGSGGSADPVEACACGAGGAALLVVVGRGGVDPASARARGVKSTAPGRLLLLVVVVVAWGGADPVL